MSFILSKIFWMFVTPGNLLTLLLLAGGFLAMAQRPSWQDFGRHLCFVVGFLMFLIAIFPVGDWAVRPLENRFPEALPDRADGVIMLGGGENTLLTEARGQPSVGYSAPRYIAFMEMAQKWPQAKLVYTGGSGMLMPAAKTTEAEVAQRELADMGFPLNRLIVEPKSRNTRENAIFSDALVHPKPGEKWVLVTSAFHMPRAMACFRKAGWDVYPMPVDYLSPGYFSGAVNFNLTQHLHDLTVAVHEYIGLISYWLMGYIDTPWPH